MSEPRDIIARTRRFAHLILSSAEQADRFVFDVIEQEQSRLTIGDTEHLRTSLYRSLCDRLASSEDGEANGIDRDGLPVIGKFRSLPLINRMAFALMVIEEFPSDTAARILRLSDDSLEEKIDQSRKLMFEE